jgi:hypothetical protein
MSKTTLARKARMTAPGLARDAELKRIRDRRLEGRDVAWDRVESGVGDFCISLDLLAAARR